MEREKTLEASASLKHIRVTPQKARRVVNLVRGRGIDEALAILKFSPQGVSEPIYKLVNSAKANYLQVAGRVDESKLVIAEIFVDEARTYKRFRPRAKGSGARILKRGSHITVIVTEGGK